MGSLVELCGADGHAFRAYVVGTPSPAGGVVLCHDDAGFTRAARQMADRLARAGYSVVVPALFDRADPDMSQSYMPSERMRGRAVAKALQIEHIGTDVAAAAAALGTPALGLVGMGWGATAAWRLAARSVRYSAVVCYYGTGIMTARHEAPRCPAQLHIGDFDDEIMGHHIGAIRRDRPEVKIELYPGARQDFLIEESENYEPMATITATDNTLIFLRRHMAAVERADEAVVTKATIMKVAPAMPVGAIAALPQLQMVGTSAVPEAATVAEIVELRKPVWQPARPVVFGRRATA